MNLAKMLRPLGWRVIEYAAGASESEADEHVEVVTGEELGAFSEPDQAPVRGSQLWRLFDSRLAVEFAKRPQPGDFVAHVLGAAHRTLVGDHSQLVHVEPGVGYSDHAFGAYRIFESRAWRAYMLGASDGARPDRKKIANPAATWVVPMAFNLDEWPVGSGSGGYLVHLGRFHPSKGPKTLAAIVERLVQSPTPVPVVIAGRGDWPSWKAALSPAAQTIVDLRGEVLGRARADLLGKALAAIYPTAIQEPFGAAAVEGMLCGTPALTSDFGGFEDNVLHGYTGYLCREPAEFVASVMACAATPTALRENTARWARAQFSLSECGPRLNKALMAAARLRA